MAPLSGRLGYNCAQDQEEGEEEDDDDDEESDKLSLPPEPAPDELKSKLLEGGDIAELYIGEYYKLIKGDTRSLDYS